MMPEKTIFITGAASGIGKETATLFAERGWYVGLYDIREPALQALYHALKGERCCYQALDVADPDSVQAALDHFAAHTGGRLHVLFNSAGVFATGPFETLEQDTHHRMMDVNVKGVLNCMYLAFPLLRKTPGARVINMASASAVYGTPDLASYSASKFAVRALTEALHIEWARHGIIVSDILPPFVDTPMVQQARKTKSMERLGIHLTPEQIAGIVWKATHGTRIHWVVTAQFKLLWWLSGLFPTRLNHLVTRFIAGY